MGLSAKVKNSEVAASSSIYAGVRIVDSVVGDNCSIGDNSSLLKSTINDHVIINRNCALDRSEVGFGTYLNQNDVVKNTVIGKFCCISWNVTLYGESKHNYRSPSMYTSYHWKSIFGESAGTGKDVGKTIIGNDVWIGNGAIVINGVTVGDGAVIGAGAVVTKDVEPYTVVAGVPARPIHKRFSEDTIQRLLRIQWWNWPLEVIKDNESLIRIENLDDTNLRKLQDIADRIQSR